MNDQRKKTPPILEQITKGKKAEPKSKPAASRVGDRKNAKKRTVYFDNDLWRRLKLYAVKNDTSMTVILETLAKEFLKSHEKHDA